METTSRLGPSSERFARLVRDLEAGGRLRWDPERRAHRAPVRETDAADARADAATLALLLNGVRRRRVTGDARQAPRP